MCERNGILKIQLLYVLCPLFAESKKPSCADVKCPPAKICVINSAGQPTCRCLIECTKKLGTGPVCGMNGKVYPDLCDLQNDECATGDYILVKKYGSCKKEGTSLKSFASCFFNCPTVNFFQSPIQRS